MIYGELGIFPIVLDMKYRTISYWIKLIENASSDNVKLSTKTYILLYNLYNVNFVKSKWIENVKNILVECGLPGVWYNQYFLNGKLLKSLLLQKLEDIFIQHWHSDTERTSNTSLYKHFKTSFGTSNYINSLDKSSCKTLIAFLTRNHRLPIEIGRWQNIPSHDRKCIFDCNDTGDEYHYLIKCHVFNHERSQYLHKYYYQRPNMYKFVELLQSKHVRKLSVFCFLVMKKFKL